VLTNLVSNALKYGPGKPVEVRVFARGDRAILQVRDQGIGIGAEDHDRIFERFERAVSERNYGGFGLGLWIVRRIVEALGGTVTVESAAGSGATFTVELRRAPEQRVRDRDPLEPQIQA
jgi:signal transduction histidine kinase